MMNLILAVKKQEKIMLSLGSNLSIIVLKLSIELANQFAVFETYMVRLGDLKKKSRFELLKYIYKKGLTKICPL